MKKERMERDIRRKRRKIGGKDIMLREEPNGKDMRMNKMRGIMMGRDRE